MEYLATAWAAYTRLGFNVRPLIDACERAMRATPVIVRSLHEP
jgi:hypothetical protein